MKPKSLAFRLMLTSGLIAGAMLLLAAYVLNNLFQQAIERNFDARLRAVMDGVIGNVELNAEGAPVMTGSIADTRFSLPMSGWYWQVTSDSNDASDTLVSESLLEKRLQPAPNLLASRGADGIAAFSMQDSEGKKLRVIEQPFELFGSKQKYSFLVAGNFDELRAEVDAFRRILYLVLGILGIGLVAAILTQVKLGLRPLEEIEENLNDIRIGKAERLKSDYPTELQSVADELNLLITSNTEVLERARTHVGNLAHALKTPLSVLTNEAATRSSGLAEKVEEQAVVMQDQINLYLDRARRAARVKSLAVSVEMEPVIAGLARTLEKINRARNISVAVECDKLLRFRGERQDLEEIVGNLLDNACKWGKSKVEVVVRRTDDKSGRAWLEMTVDDDGPGIDEKHFSDALQRGKRLDESTPGSGLGLNIVSELVAMYGGRIGLSKSAWNGLRVSIVLPAAL